MVLSYKVVSNRCQVNDFLAFLAFYSGCFVVYWFSY